jgi:DNA-binding NarL/FixJ family response regulator
MAIVSAPRTTSGETRDIRVLVLDDHPALRTGLRTLLESEPGFRLAGAMPRADGLLAAMGESRPDVVVLDYALGAHDGLTTCFRVKQQPDAPAVVLYTAHVDDVFAVPAAIAQADAVVAKTAPVDALLSAIRGAATGTLARPRLDAELVHAASARLLTDDLPIATMLLGGTRVRDIAMTLGLAPDDVGRRALRIIGRLQAGTGETGTGTVMVGSTPAS